MALNEFSKEVCNTKHDNIDRQTRSLCVADDKFSGELKDMRVELGELAVAQAGLATNIVNLTQAIDGVNTVVQNVHQHDKDIIALNYKVQSAQDAATRAENSAMAVDGKLDKLDTKLDVLGKKFYMVIGVGLAISWIVEIVAIPVIHRVFG